MAEAVATMPTAAQVAPQVAATDEAMRIALENDVKAAEKELERRRQIASASARPRIKEFAGFVGAGLREGVFAIYGENLGKVHPLSVQLNGHTVKVTGIKATSIKGHVPFDVKPGPVKVKVGDITFDGMVTE